MNRMAGSNRFRRFASNAVSLPRISAFRRTSVSFLATYSSSLTYPETLTFTASEKTAIDVRFEAWSLRFTLFLHHSLNFVEKFFGDEWLMFSFKQFTMEVHHTVIERIRDLDALDVGCSNNLVVLQRGW